MEQQDILKVARDGEVVAELPKSEIIAAVSSGRLFLTDYYLEDSSNSWKPLAELIQTEPLVSKENFFQEIALGVSIILVLGLIVFVSASSNQPAATIQPAASSQPVVPQVDHAAIARSKAEATLAEVTVRVNALLPKFIAREDKFQELTWYQHAYQDALLQGLYSSPPAAFVTVNVNSRGGRYIECYHFAERSIFFRHVIFLVAGVKHESRTASSHDYEVISGGVLEWCNFLDEQDRTLCGVIADAVKSGKGISCRLSGSGNRVFDWEPTSKELQMVADAVDLADALRAKREAETALSGLSGR
jgi:hypothetical protein